MKEHTILKIRVLLEASTGKEIEAMWDRGDIELYLYSPSDVYVVRLNKSKQFRLILNKKVASFNWPLPWPPASLSRADPKNVYHSGKIERAYQVKQWRKVPKKLKEWFVSNV